MKVRRKITKGTAFERYARAFAPKLMPEAQARVNRSTISKIRRQARPEVFDECAAVVRSFKAFEEWLATAPRRNLPMAEFIEKGDRLERLTWAIGDTPKSPERKAAQREVRKLLGVKNPGQQRYSAARIQLEEYVLAILLHHGHGRTAYRLAAEIITVLGAAPIRSTDYKYSLGNRHHRPT